MECFNTDVGIKKMKLSNFVMHDHHKNVQEVLMRSLGEDVTITDLTDMSDSELMRLPGIGKIVLIQLREMLKDIQDGRFAVKISSSSPALKESHFTDEYEISLDQLEKDIIHGIDDFVNTLDEINLHVFVNRYGWKTSQLTLEAVGESMPGGEVTRERVRQRQLKICKRFKEEFPVSSKLLWVNIRSNLSLLDDPLFPKLRTCFDEDSSFYEFLEICCDVKKSRVESVTRPTIKNNILDEYWLQRVSPASIGDVSLYIETEYGYEHAMSDNALVVLNEKGVIEIRGNNIYPKSLSKAVAYAHVLLLYPDGQDWQTIQSKINEIDVVKAKLPLHRIDASAGSAVDSDWIYQCDRGMYRSLTYLDVTQEDIDATLVALKKRLKEEKVLGRRSINLSVDFYESSTKKLDYFVVRHIVRNFGEKEKIFFKGKSGADTVSLDEDFTLASQKNVIVEMFDRSKKPLTKQNIASAIRSQSVRHALYYLDILIKENEVVRVGKNAYSSAVKTFEGVDIPVIVKAAARVVENQDFPIDSEVLQQHMNRELDLENNKYFYLSLLRIHAPALGYQWYFARDYISRNKPDFA